MRKDVYFYEASTGRTYKRNRGCIPLVRVWTSVMLTDLRRWYATSTNAELADIFGVSESSVYRKARKLGLKKDAGWLKRLRRNSLYMATSCWKRNGNRGQFQPGNVAGRANWFKRAIVSV